MIGLTTELRRIKRYPSLRQYLKLPDDESRSLVDRAADEILSRIISGKFSPGYSLKSTQLASTLNMSRTPVAGALARLADDGVLVQSYNHAAVVGPKAKEWLVHVHQLRQLLEPEAAALAAGQLPDDVVEDFHVLIADARPSRREAWDRAAMLLDYALHLSIAEFCGNQPLGAAIRKCWSYKRLSYQLSDGCARNLRTEYSEHEAIFEALEAGKTRQSRTLMANHLKTASQTRTTRRVV